MCAQHFAEDLKTTAIKKKQQKAKDVLVVLNLPMKQMSLENPSCENCAAKTKVLAPLMLEAFLYL